MFFRIPGSMVCSVVSTMQLGRTWWQEYDHLNHRNCFCSCKKSISHVLTFCSPLSFTELAPLLYRNGMGGILRGVTKTSFLLSTAPSHLLQLQTAAFFIHPLTLEPTLSSSYASTVSKQKSSTSSLERRQSVDKILACTAELKTH